MGEEEVSTVMGVKEHGVNGELGANALHDVQQIQHLLNRLVPLLSHSSTYKVLRLGSAEWEEGKMEMGACTCGLEGCRR